MESSLEKSFHYSQNFGCIIHSIYYRRGSYSLATIDLSVMSWQYFVVALYD